jgi:membrane protein implicated in regulation of membrane protease activity
MRNKTARYAAVVGLAFMALLLTSCVKTISEIKAEPDRYVNKDVGIKGQVTESFSILGRGAYQVDDGTGKLWVVSQKGVPRKGARVTVKGKIRDGFDLGSIVRLPEAVSSGMVMIEEKHKADY